MELKEMILSTLKELDEGVQTEEKQTLQAPKRRESSEEEPTFEPEPILEIEETIETLKVYGSLHESENDEVHRQFYRNLRERILVLFEGFQSPNNKNIEAKIDLTLNFLEYLLATIDEQLERMDKPH